MQSHKVKTIKSELHHWWPRGFFKFWANEKGVVHQLRFDGAEIPHGSPKNYGALTNAHIIKLSATTTVWDQNFESQFDKIDSNLATTVSFLEELSPPELKENAHFSERFLPLSISNEKLDAILELMLSLIVRSPRFRNSIKVTVDYYRGRIGASMPPANPALINLNLRDAMKKFLEHAKGRGKFAFLFSDATEFIYGDGCFNNYVSCANAPLSPRVLISLTPRIAVLYYLPTMYSSEPRATAIHLGKNEVGFVNMVTQIYSGDSIFYKSQKPAISQEFQGGEFLEFQFSGEPHWLAELSHALATYRVV